MTRGWSVAALLFAAGGPCAAAFVPSLYYKTGNGYFRKQQRLASVMADGTTKADASTTTAAASIILPNQTFRDTQPGELSVVSLNILAPSYHWIGHGDDEDERDRIANKDRHQRVPKSIQQAARTNADILCLQEVEGGPKYEPLLREWLDSGSSSTKYEFVWSALHPNRRGDVVGNCIAWKPKKYDLISADCFRRGMVAQMEEIETGSNFCIGNVHLPAKPSAIEGRLNSISTTIKKIEGCEKPRKLKGIDGTVIIAGDFNCDHNSVTAELLKRGTAPYGTVRDRNYKAKITKASSHIMRHNYRFKDIYEGELRESAAPVTVSLKGRGPGCMDHMFYASGEAALSSSGRGRAGGTTASMTKRGSRRERAVQRAAVVASTEAPSSSLRVEAVLATIDPDDISRTQIIKDGLPNEEEGFPTDHIPIGAIFVADDSMKGQQETRFHGDDSKQAPSDSVVNGSLSPNARRRRENYLRSLVVRRRHNAILRATSEWLIAKGDVTDIIRDQPLYKWKWVDGLSKGLKKKMRAPDLCCVLGGKSLVVVEITVTSKPDHMRREKIKKYTDLIDVLRSSKVVQDAGLTVVDTFVVLMDEGGGVPSETRKDIEKLAELLGSSAEDAMLDSKRFCNKLERVFVDSSSS